MKVVTLSPKGMGVIVADLIDRSTMFVLPITLPPRETTPEEIPPLSWGRLMLTMETVHGEEFCDVETHSELMHDALISNNIGVHIATGDKVFDALCATFFIPTFFTTWMTENSWAYAYYQELLNLHIRYPTKEFRCVLFDAPTSFIVKLRSVAKHRIDNLTVFNVVETWE